ncbi:MAG: hypothetical protein V3R39_01965, partial [Nitrosopumilus sp.]
MVKLGLIQTISYSTNQKGISKVSEMLRRLGKKEAEIVCLPEQCLKKNVILDFDSEFSDFKKIAKDFLSGAGKKRWLLLLSLIQSGSSRQRPS